MSDSNDESILSRSQQFNHRLSTQARPSLQIRSGSEDAEPHQSSSSSLKTSPSHVGDSSERERERIQLEARSSRDAQLFSRGNTTFVKQVMMKQQKVLMEKIKHEIVTAELIKREQEQVESYSRDKKFVLNKKSHSPQPRKILPNGHIESHSNYWERLSEVEQRVDEWDSFTEDSDEYNRLHGANNKQVRIKAMNEDEMRYRVQKKVFGTENDSDQSFKETENHIRHILNVGSCNYPLVRKVARRILNFRLKKFREDNDGALCYGTGGWKLSPAWDVTWHDKDIDTGFLMKMLPYQKVNRYPGIQVLTRKNNLAVGLQQMAEVFGKEYEFFPRTWVLPKDLLELRSHWFRHNKSRPKPSPGSPEQQSPKPRKLVTYVVKPDRLQNGRGMFLSRHIDHMLPIALDHGYNPYLKKRCINGALSPSKNAPNQNELGSPKRSNIKVDYVVQQYVSAPHLVNDYKYDLRLFVTLYGVAPLRVYMHKYGIARFCTESYEKPTNFNLGNLGAHFTKYALPRKEHSRVKDSFYGEEDDALSEEETNHYHSLGAILHIIELQGGDSQALLEDLKDAIVKTVISGTPHLSYLYRACQPACLDNSMCFQLLAFDFQIDSNFKPWLLEVDGAPSFRTIQSLDYAIKKNVLADTLRLLNFDLEKRSQFAQILPGQSDSARSQSSNTNSNVLNRILKAPQHQLEMLQRSQMKRRYEYESTHMGGYELLYPCADDSKQLKYDTILSKATQLYDQSLTKSKRKKLGLQNDLKLLVSVKKAQNQREFFPAPTTSNTAASWAAIPAKEHSTQKIKVQVESDSSGGGDGDGLNNSSVRFSNYSRVKGSPKKLVVHMNKGSDSNNLEAHKFGAQDLFLATQQQIPSLNRKSFALNRLQIDGSQMLRTQLSPSIDKGAQRPDNHKNGRHTRKHDQPIRNSPSIMRNANDFSKKSGNLMFNDSERSSPRTTRPHFPYQPEIGQEAEYPQQLAHFSAKDGSTPRAALAIDTREVSALFKQQQRHGTQQDFRKKQSSSQLVATERYIQLAHQVHVDFSNSSALGNACQTNLSDQSDDKKKKLKSGLDIPRISPRQIPQNNFNFIKRTPNSRNDQSTYQKYQNTQLTAKGTALLGAQNLKNYLDSSKKTRAHALVRDSCDALRNVKDYQKQLSKLLKSMPNCIRSVQKLSKSCNKSVISSQNFNQQNRDIYEVSQNARGTFGWETQNMNSNQTLTKSRLQSGRQRENVSATTALAESRNIDNSYSGFNYVGQQSLPGITRALQLVLNEETQPDLVSKSALGHQEKADYQNECEAWVAAPIFMSPRIQNPVLPPQLQKTQLQKREPKKYIHAAVSPPPSFRLKTKSPLLKQPKTRQSDLHDLNTENPFVMIGPENRRVQKVQGPVRFEVCHFRQKQDSELDQQHLQSKEEPPKFTIGLMPSTVRAHNRPAFPSSLPHKRITKIYKNQRLHELQQLGRSTEQLQTCSVSGGTTLIDGSTMQADAKMLQDESQPLHYRLMMNKKELHKNSEKHQRHYMLRYDVQQPLKQKKQRETATEMRFKPWKSQIKERGLQNASPILQRPTQRHL